MLRYLLYYGIGDLFVECIIASMCVYSSWAESII